MEKPTTNLGQLVDSSKGFARRLLTLGENRLELLMVEVQEERERLLHAMLLGFAAIAFGFLATFAFSVALVILLWKLSPVLVLLMLTGIYGAAAFYCYRRLNLLLREWQNLPATLNQLQKDRACLEKTLT